MDSQYTSRPFIFASRGINARNAPDRLPQGSYINLLGGFERLEETMSSRYGSQIVNRDPNGTGDGTNYLFVQPVNTITRLKYNENTWRYASSGGDFYRRMGDTQGAYTPIYFGLSQQPCGNAVTNCFASSQPYIFIADQNLMFKDSGTGLPTQWGITPPSQPANATEYAPQILLIDGFTSSLGDYSLSNVTGWAEESIGVVTVTTSEAVNNFYNFGGTITNFIDAFTGGLAATDAGVQAVIFNPYGAPNPEQFSASGVSATLPGTARNFTLTGYRGSVAANVTGTIGRTVDLDLSQNNQVTDQHLICFGMQLDNPANISQINIRFDINNSGYTSSYYQASISPAYYQSGLDNTTDAYTTTSNEILALSLGVITGDNSAQQQQLTQSIVNQLQPSEANTGLGAWSTVYTQRGNFLAVGNAGQPGFDWASVTGWQIEVVTTTSGSVTIGCNGLYLQWNGGPSSFGGVGYDYRFTYFNFNTQTESNPCPEQFFNTQFGYPASYIPPIVLCQNFNVTGQYAIDPQVTHIRLYRRGGYMNANWYYLDQIPNITDGGTFSYKDIIPDAYILQSNILALDNDAPITSALQNPLSTTLVSASTSPGTSPYDLFAPQEIRVTDSSAVFLENQIVVVGTPQNLEEVTVVVGGTGVFFATLRLIHQAGEQVQAFSIPQQPCDLVTLAYGQLWVAGDPNNPHFLYYSKPGYPENFSPQNYIPCGSPSSPIMAVINYRGNLFVATLTTWYAISPGNPPYAQPTGSTHGLVSKTGWTQAESSIWYSAIDGIREFKGADGPYRSLPIEWIFQDVAQTPLPLLDRTQIGNICAGFLNNCVPESAEILTQEGWKIHDQLSIGETVLSYDPATQTCKWTPLEAITVQDFDGELTRWENSKRFSFDFTPNHKWAWLKDNLKGNEEVKLVEANHIPRYGKIIQSAPLELGAESLLTPKEAAILGWIATDGRFAKTSPGKRARRFAIIQQKHDSVDVPALNDLLEGICTERREAIVTTKGQNGEYRKVKMYTYYLPVAFAEPFFRKCGLESWEDLPRIALSLDREAAKSMLDAMLAGDGHVGKQTWFCQKAGRPHIEAFRLLAIISGFTTSPARLDVAGKNSLGNCTMEVVSLHKKPSMKRSNLREKKVHYAGKIWCPTTKHGTWVCRSDGRISITGNTVFVGYQALDGTQNRVVWSTDYSRWRNDNVPATAMYLEQDTNVLLFAKALTSGAEPGYVICQEWVGDYDDGGWVNGQLVKTPIDMGIQMPYEDLGAPHFPKNWNTVEIDANTNGQTMDVILNFDDGIAPLNIGTINTTIRQKIQLDVNGGLGQESYKCSPQITASTIVAPILYQLNVYAAVLAADRDSLDTYWTGLSGAGGAGAGGDVSKFVKQAYLDYTSTEPVTISIYADGGTNPYYTVTLPAQPNRVVIRVRFPALKLRLFRMIVTSNAAMQTWTAPRIEYKPILASGASGYATYEVTT